MTTPVAPNPLKMSDINIELGNASTATLNMDNANLRKLFGVLGSLSTISMSSGRGKTKSIDLTIAADTASYNIKTAAIAAGWDGTSQIVVNVTINSGVVVYSSSTGAYAMTTDTSWPAGSSINIINNGYILGMGGAGGAGGRSSSSGRNNGSAGAAGGSALNVLFATTITNNGTVGGGGGGGGGDGGDYFTSLGVPFYIGGNGGDGGQTGRTNSAGGAGGGGPNNGNPGVAGTFSTPRTGAGAGGSWGVVGTKGANNSATGGNGGAAGKSIVGISLVTYALAGTILGPTA